jgi:hypothetical protein
LLKSRRIHLTYLELIGQLDNAPTPIEKEKEKI